MKKSDDDATGGTPPQTRTFVSRGFTWVEDIVYIGLGGLLSACALVLLVSTAISFFHDMTQGAEPSGIVNVLDRLLLVLVIVELLYTVQVSFREHALVPEPFLIVGLVAVTRRILVVTAEFTRTPQLDADVFRLSMIELGVLTLMVLALVISLLLLRKRGPDAVPPRV